MTVIAAATVLLGAIVLAAGVVRARREPPGTGGVQQPAGAAGQQTWLLVGTVEADPTGEANWLSVLSWDPGAGRGFMMYVPRSTLTEIPGHGQDGLAKAMALGREPLATLTTANLLGISFDRYLKISDQAVRALFDELGGVTVEVDRKLTRVAQDGRAQVVFAEGRQHLDGKRVAEYLAFVEEPGDEISRAVRHAKVWSALFDRYRREGQQPVLARTVAQAGDLFVTDAEGDELEAFFGGLAALPENGIRFETMPVRATGVETGSPLYAPEREAVEGMVNQYLAGSRPKGAGREGRRVEVLNGNGEPGVGHRVADVLIPEGFRIVLNQNAKRFDYDVTQIVVYSDAKDAIEVGEEIRKALGVGEILISRQRQGIVDVTIVVGRDYLSAKR